MNPPLNNLGESTYIVRIQRDGSVIESVTKIKPLFSKSGALKALSFARSSRDLGV